MKYSKSQGPRKLSSMVGFTLMEMMIALVILSIGLLGIAGLQVSVAKYKINTWARSSVAGLLSDLAERIRVNADAAGGNYVNGVMDTSSTMAYTLADNWSEQQAVNPQTLLDAAKQCETVDACTSAERATYDMANWRTRVRNSVPQGAALVSGGKNAGVQMTIMWFDKNFLELDLMGKLTVQASSPTCTGSEAQGMAQQSCCPAAANVPAGVRCASFLFIP